jgi:hypothetical protein
MLLLFMWDYIFIIRYGAEVILLVFDVILYTVNLN